jgi:hypothetical protein
LLARAGDSNSRLLLLALLLLVPVVLWPRQPLLAALLSGPAPRLVQLQHLAADGHCCCSMLVPGRRPCPAVPVLLVLLTLQDTVHETER